MHNRHVFEAQFSTTLLQIGRYFDMKFAAIASQKNKNFLHKIDT
jgi:hypothetical protein